MTDKEEDHNGNSNKEPVASNLMGLFAPPTPTTNHASAQKAEGGGESIHANDSIPEETPVTATAQTYQSFDMLRSFDDIDYAHADMEAPAGSISYMMGLFSAPGNNNNNSGEGSQKSSLAATSESKESTPLLGDSFSSWKDSSMDAATPKTNTRTRKLQSAYENNGGKAPSVRHIRLPSVAMPVIEESLPSDGTMGQAKFGTAAHQQRGWQKPTWQAIQMRAKNAVKPTTLIGAFMYLLYHVVFCLALGSAINRPHSKTSLLGLMTKTAALGTISSSACYWWFLSSEIPALYPTAVRTGIRVGRLQQKIVALLLFSDICRFSSTLLHNRIFSWLHSWQTWQLKWTKLLLKTRVSHQNKTMPPSWLHLDC